MSILKNFEFLFMWIKKKIHRMSIIKKSIDLLVMPVKQILEISEMSIKNLEILVISI